MKITPENILDALKMHALELTPQVCLIAGQEIARLRADVERMRDALVDAQRWMSMDPDSRIVAHPTYCKITAALADT